MQSEITGKYIIFGSSSQSRPTGSEIPGIGNNQESDPKTSSKLEPWGFKCPKFGFKDSPTLVATATENIGKLYNQEDMHKLNPPVVKQTKENLGKAYNDDLDVTGLPPMVEDKEGNTTSKRPLSCNQPNKQKKACSMSKISCISNSISHQSKKEKQQQTAAFPGILVWEDMFKDENLKLTDTSFMNQLRQSVPHEQCQKILMK